MKLKKLLLGIGVFCCVFISSDASQVKKSRSCDALRWPSMHLQGGFACRCINREYAKEMAARAKRLKQELVAHQIKETGAYDLDHDGADEGEKIANCAFSFEETDLLQQLNGSIFDIDLSSSDYMDKAILICSLLESCLKNGISRDFINRSLNYLKSLLSLAKVVDKDYLWNIFQDLRGQFDELSKEYDS